VYALGSAFPTRREVDRLRPTEGERVDKEGERVDKWITPYGDHPFLP